MTFETKTLPNENQVIPCCTWISKHTFAFQNPKWCFIPSTEERVLRKKLKWVCLFVCVGSKKQFLWIHGNIEFYTNPRSVDVSTHPVALTEHSRDLKTFLNIKWKCYFCHIFRAEWWSTLFIVTFVLIHDKFPTQNSLWWFNFMNELSVS